MQHYGSLDGVALQDCWLTIGSFDGVHKGHQAILEKLTAGAHASGVPAVVITFHPHPSVVLGKRQDFSYLTSPEERAVLLSALGVDIVITLRFDHQLANLSAGEFVANLHTHLHLKRLWVGHDFALGRGREGDIPTLKRLGGEFGYTVEVVSPVEFEGQVISSSQIRAALTEGDVERASRMLGRLYQVEGEVVHGDGRGCTLGIPTANLQVWGGRALPRAGVYACLAQVDGQQWQAVSNIGYRPTFEGQPATPQVEAHLLDFERDLYSRRVALDFVARLRDEQRFPNVQALVQQIRADIQRARQIMPLP